MTFSGTFPEKNEKYIEEKMKLAKYGRKQWLTATVLLVLMLVCSGVLMCFTLSGSCFLAALSFVLWLGYAAFFRDPHRVIGQDKRELVAPADGIVKDIELIPNISCENEDLRKLFEGYDILRIGIVQSLFDVHVNRAPCELTVRTKIYSEKSSSETAEGRKEEARVLLLCGTGVIGENHFPVAVRQISTSSLRRIVCTAEEEDKLKKGARYGMIQFGCRIELYLPAKSPVSIIVNTNERVLAGKTVLAVFSSAKQSS